jgi:hypothetical protein
MGDVFCNSMFAKGSIFPASICQDAQFFETPLWPTSVQPKKKAVGIRNFLPG